MRRIRIEISLGIAAVSLIGLANTAVAKDNDPPRFKTEIQLNAANDGRGDTREFRAERPTAERAPQKSDDERPTAGDVFAKQQAPQFRTEVVMRANGERDRGSEVEARPAVDAASRPADEKEAQPVIEKKPEMPQMKTEIMLKVSGERGTDEASTGTNAKTNLTSTKTLKPSLSSLPIMTEIKLRAGHGNNENMQGESDER